MKYIYVLQEVFFNTSRSIPHLFQTIPERIEKPSRGGFRGLNSQHYKCCETKQSIFDNGVEYFTNSNYQWDAQKVKEEGLKMTPVAYQNLPEKQRSLNHSLRVSTYNAGRNRMSPSEAYKGYLEDFKKGLNKKWK